MAFSLEPTAGGVRPPGPEETFFHYTDLGMAVADRDLVIEAVNPAWSASFGSAAVFGPGSSLADVLPAELLVDLTTQAQRPWARFQLLPAAGSRWVEVGLKVTDERVLVVLVEAADEAVDEARRTRDLLLHDASVGTWRYNPDSELYDFSPELRSRPLGYGDWTELASIPRLLVESLCHPDDLVMEQPLRERITRDGGTGEMELRMRDPATGGWNHLKIMLRSGRRLPSGNYEMYGLTQLVTELAHARDEARSNAERVRLLASIDVLTGLANRLSFDEQLERAIAGYARTGASFAVLYVDLDRFKEVNDTLGHAAGDELIQETARRLTDTCRAEDTVARLGGDEFAIIQTGAQGSEAATLAERIVSRLSGRVDLAAGRATLSCSLGVALTTGGKVDRDQLLRHADLALYRAKSQGRGRYCFYEPEMDAALKAKKALEADLVEAVAQELIQVAYQPLVRSDGSLLGVEALARWTHPLRGVIGPAVFIPLAEQSDLILALGDVVFRRICIDTAPWPELRVSMNVSPLQISRPGLISRYREILDETSTSARRFEIEITEGCLLQDDPRTQETLKTLRDMGFRLSLDDFGTGFSSLSYLHTYPIDRIKLDRAFVSRLSDGADAVAVVRALIQLAAALKLEIVAEGIETREQLLRLVDMGVREFQGFLFSRPLSIDALRKWMRTPPATIVELAAA